jgi:muramidase (phage lysozyme)
MPVSSLLSPEKIVGGRKVSPSSFQNFVSGGAPLGSSVVSSAANNVVGFQRASVRPATPDLSSIVNTISSNILSQVSNQIESVTNIVNKNVDAKVEQVRSEVTREIQPLYTKQENNITQLQSVVQNITQKADSTITKIVEEYKKKVSEVDDAKPTGILGNFLKVFKGALDFIQFFASKKNLDNLDSNLKSLQKIFADSFEVAKLIRNTINKIVGQLSNLPTASPSGSPGLNIDVKVPGQGLKQTAPKGLGNLMKKGGMFALGAGGLAAGATAVNALADTGVAPVQRQPGFMGGLVEGLGGIVESFTSAVNSLIKGSNDKSGGTSGGGGGGGAKTGPGGGPSTAPGGPSSSGKVDTSKISGDTPEQKAFLATVGSTEAGTYNTIVGGQQIPELTKMTIQEVYDMGMKSPIMSGKLPDRFGGRSIKYGADSHAMGRYQFIPQTMMSAMKSAGLNPTDLYSPENQDKMALAFATTIGINVNRPMTESDYKKAGSSVAWEGMRKISYTEAKKRYDNYLTQVRSATKGQGGPDLPDWKLSPEKREELKNMATKVAQPPPSQAAPSVNVMPFDFSTQMPQQKSSGSQSPSSGPAAPAGAQGPTAPFLPAGNTDNFLILYSKIIYNIVDG